MLAPLCLQQSRLIIRRHEPMAHPRSLFEEFAAQRPSLSDEGVVRAICEWLLDEAEAQPPVDVDILASICGISRIEYRAQPYAGMLVPTSGQLVASVRATDGLERRRFTVLHEGGHTLLPDFRRDRQYRCKGPRTRQEELCDIAAAEMLLPRRFFVADLFDAGDDLEAVEALAPRYLASMQATALRVVSLADSATMLAVFRVAHKPIEQGREDQVAPRLRLQWAASRGDWPYLLRHKSVSPGSPFSRAWANEPVDELADVNEIFGDPVPPVHVSARRYGDHVLALLRRAIGAGCG